MEPLTFSLGGLAFFVRAFALRDVDHGTHELNEIARSVEDRMSYAVNVPDPLVRMNNSVVKFAIHLLSNRSLDLFPAIRLIVRMNPPHDGFQWWWGSMRLETQHAITLVRIVSVVGCRAPGPATSVTQLLCLAHVCLSTLQLLCQEFLLCDIHCR